MAVSRLLFGCCRGHQKNLQQMASDQHLTISVHDSLESLESLRPEWDALLDEYPLSTTFSTYEWLVPWWHAFGGNDSLLVLALRDASSALVGFVRSGCRFEFCISWVTAATIQTTWICRCGPVMKTSSAAACSTG